MLEGVDLRVVITRCWEYIIQGGQWREIEIRSLAWQWSMTS